MSNFGTFTRDIDGTASHVVAGSADEAVRLQFSGWRRVPDQQPDTPPPPVPDPGATTEAAAPAAEPPAPKSTTK